MVAPLTKITGPLGNWHSSSLPKGTERFEHRRVPVRWIPILVIFPQNMYFMTGAFVKPALEQNMKIYFRVNRDIPLPTLIHAK
jgi:hypothetical protein